MIKNNRHQRLSNLLLLLNTTNSIFNLSTNIFDLLPDLGVPFSSGTNFTKLGLTEEETSKLKSPNWRQVVERDLAWAEKEGHHLITICDNDYPELLKEIPNPPLVLFVIGDLSLLKASQIALVGSRNPTPAGVEIAYDFARALSGASVIITSGFAAGIDAASHRGAFENSGKTIAVMGTGLNRRYPRQNANLADKIVAGGGVLLSEFPLDREAEAWHFPLRNRIISGLSIGTLVVEATLRSGSLITARLAGEQGREVFAIPGSIYNSTARGCHYLIRQGAKLVEQPSDILEEFPGLIANLERRFLEAKKNKLDCEYQKLLDCMGFELMAIDSLAARAALPVAQVGIMLVELELAGIVKSSTGGYIRTV